MSGLPEIKICGLTREDDVALCVRLGTDYLGFNFVPSSPRCLPLDRALALADAARAAGSTRLVGVFANQHPERVEEIAERVGLDLFQFHGEENFEQIAPFLPRSIKAFRRPHPPLEAELAPYANAYALLFDAYHPTQLGGTGEAWDFAALAPLAHPGRRIFVAGGISPENACAALAASRATALDVCSRVESAPGIKDSTKLEALFSRLRSVAR